MNQYNTLLSEKCSAKIAKPLCYIINQSLSTGIFPNRLKLAVVKPIYKKGDIENLNNYRPISLLSPFSKTLKTIVAQQTMKFFIKNKLFKESQHGFIKGKSTMTAKFQRIQSILDAFENNQYSQSAYSWILAKHLTAQITNFFWTNYIHMVFEVQPMNRIRATSRTENRQLNWRKTKDLRLWQQIRVYRKEVFSALCCLYYL